MRTSVPFLWVSALSLLSAGCGGSEDPVRESRNSPPQSVISTTSALSGAGLSVNVSTTVVTPRQLPSGAVAHAITVAEAVRDAGLGCQTASLATRPPTSVVGDPREQVDCEIGGDSVVISLFDDRESLERGMAVARVGLCGAARDGPSNLTYAKGDNWIVFPEHKAVAQAVAEKLAVTVEVVRC